MSSRRPAAPSARPQRKGSVAGRSANAWDYYVSGGYEREDGWRQATGGRNYNGFLNLGRLEPEHGISLQAYAVKSRAETAGSLPESVFDKSPEVNFTAGDFDDLNAQQVAVSGYACMWRGQGSLTTYFRRSAAERFNVNQTPDPNVRGFTTNYTAGATADWRRTTELGRGALAIRAGFDGAANSVRVRIFTEPQAARWVSVAPDGTFQGSSQTSSTRNARRSGPSTRIAERGSSSVSSRP